MPPEGKVTDLTPGVVARLVQGARYVMSGVAPDGWFGPSQPLQPMAPASVEGRRFDYAVAYNLDQRPRGYEPVGFPELRMLADNCDVLRSVIETRKDQMEAMDWVVRPRKMEGRQSDGADDKRIGEITSFLQSPDRVSTWGQWQRQLLEDRFVIDAAALYKRRTRGGKLYALEVIDGATLKPLIDDTGRTPAPPDPAYQQILHGVPAVNYTRDEVMYLMRNPRSWKSYGYSEVEQIMLTVNVAIRRALFQLEYYREGSQPDAFLSLPKEWTADQIIGFQKHFDSQLAGNLSARRKLKMVPGDAKYQETKQPPMKDEYDEWLARIVCFTFSISPQPFVKQMNRSTAGTAHDAALQEGLLPLQRWVKSFIDPVIALDFGSPDLEFAWADDREQDPKQAADIRVADVKAGIISVDEAREGMGKEPLGGAYSEPMLATATGYVAPVDAEEQAANREAAQQAAQAAREPAAEGEDAAGNDKKAKAAQKSAYSRLRKRAHKPVPFDRAATRKATKALKAKVAEILTKAGEDAASQVSQKLGKLTKDGADDKERARRIALAVDLGSLDALIDAAPDELELVAADSGGLALAQIGVGEKSDLVDQVNERAVAYAKDRAAEMVGKKWVGGELVDNPDAEWVITDSTRDELQSIITRGLEDNVGRDAMADAIREAGAFSEDRADMIAGTEIARANSVGALEGYKAARDAGVKVMKAWLPDDEPCDEICRPNVDQGPIDLDEDFDSGDGEPPGHPGCRCALIPVTEDNSGTENSDEEE
jgi:hypothetical protein